MCPKTVLLRFVGKIIFESEEIANEHITRREYR